MLEIVQDLQKVGTKVALLPGAHPRCAIYSDVSKRISTCQFCSSPIKKKSDRVVLLVMHRGVRFLSGGFKAMDTIFMHPACLAPVITGSQALANNDMVCWDCDSIGRVPMSRVAVSGGRASWLCSECVDSERYLACANCKLLVSKRTISTVVGGQADEFMEDLVGKYVCDNCAVNGGLLTAKAKAKIDRREANFQSRFDLLVSKMKAGKGFE